uniref:Cytidyltransferase-like domain-containing protein n=1 Tax=uncultured Desulfobacterium sp. TaxID=201089 RepID=E1YE86_9BACT|nr:hypothetical protein N47_B19910 [uncultured Desulfobacterium sp.]
MGNYAKIMSFDEIDKIRDQIGRLVCTSGGYDPLHPGHTSCLIESKAFGDTLIAIVNGDSFLRAKKGKPFMDLRTRCLMVSCIREVDIVVPFEIENDNTVSVALKRLRPNVFTKGGDRSDPTKIPEYPVCEELGIEIKFGIGLSKEWSSSILLNEWGEHYKRQDHK